MIDWYFAGMFDATFWGVVGKQKPKGRTAGDVLRQIVAEAGEPDLSWLSKSRLLDALCRSELSFAMKRRGMRVQWALTPFRDPPGPSGDADTIGDAIDALIGAAQMRYRIPPPP
jgi:hypothetical protein